MVTLEQVVAPVSIVGISAKKTNVLPPAGVNCDGIFKANKRLG